MSGTTHLLDTSVYSQRLRRKPLVSVVKRWQALGDARLAVSLLCEGEVLFGLHKLGSDRMWKEYHEYLKGRLPVLPLDARAMEVYAQIRWGLERQGLSREDMDLLIAATALSKGLIVATLNARHFSGIPGLVVEDWS